MQLTNENYHSMVADHEYMSVHQYQNWMECAARESARQRGEYVHPKMDALVEGQYFHVSLLQPKKLAGWLADNADDVISKAGATKGKPKAGFVAINGMAARLRGQTIWQDIDAVSSKEQIITPVIGGVKWKMQVDFIAPDCGMFGDLKSAKDFEWTWQWDAATKRNTRCPWYERYWLQLGMYQAGIAEIYGSMFTPVIVGATKQDQPDICAVDFADQQQRLSAEVAQCLANLPEVMDWKTGKTPARRCETCDYCRATKTLVFVPAECVVFKSGNI